MRKLFSYFWGIFFLIILYGCSTPAPLTETIIFPPHKALVDTTKSYRGDFTIMPAYNFFSQDALTYAKQHYDQALHKKEHYQGKIDYPNYKKKGLGFADTFTQSNNWAVGYAIGYNMLSGNFTARIKRPYYVTAQLSLRGGGQLIFQRPIVKNQNGGVTFGAYFRYDSFAMDLPVGMVSNYHFFHINSFGIRSMVLSTSPFLSFYGFIATGYSPELKTPLFYADFTIPLMKMK